jgi:hypothetical protein
LKEHARRGLDDGHRTDDQPRRVGHARGTADLIAYLNGLNK